jgi:hypothetical protein
MREKPLAQGRVAYYWAPPTRDIRAGFSIASRALGVDYGTACQLAEVLNKTLRDWRIGSDVKTLNERPGMGTLRWMVETYKRGAAWEKVGTRSRGEYERAFRLVLDHKTRTGSDLGDHMVRAMTVNAADKLYAALKKGKRVEKRIRQANVCMSRMAIAWDYVRPRNKSLFPQGEENPFRNVVFEYTHNTTKPASRGDAFALHKALVDAGEPHLAVVPLVAFEFHQRPENVLAGFFRWTDYRPSDRPNHVIVEHHKTHEMVPMPLYDDQGALFPELMEYLDNLERAGISVVLMRPSRGEKSARPFKYRTARARVRKIARQAGLAEHITMAACRHGGITELGDAELTEQGVMALTGHRAPEAARLYLKRTEAQRLLAARRRRAWVKTIEEKERSGDGSRNASPAAVSE